MHAGELLVESPLAVALLAEDGLQVLEGQRGFWDRRQEPGNGILLGPWQVARPLVAERQSYAVRERTGCSGVAALAPDRAGRRRGAAGRGSGGRS
jgi:hypothetical protein